MLSKESSPGRSGAQLYTILFFVTVFAASLFLAPAAQGADWPSWRGPNGDGKSPDTGLLKKWPEGGPPLLWKVDYIGKGFSTVAVSDGMIFTTGDIDGKHVLFAFDINGKPKWKKVHDDAWTRSHPGSRSTPVIDEGDLYILSGNGLAGCYDAKTGRKKWTRHAREFGGRTPGWGYAESILIYKNLAVFTPGGKNCIAALNKKTGRTIWTSTGFTGGAQYGSCCVFTFKNAPFIAAGTGKGIVCVFAGNGKVQCSNPFSAGNTANCPTPAYSDGYLFWANGYGKGGICLKLGVKNRALAMQEAWRTRDMNCHHGGYIIHKGYIYGNNGGRWACLDLKTGKTMWNERSVGKGSLCYADGMLYLFGESRGKVGLATCSPEGLEMRGEFSADGSGPSWAHPVVIGGRLYIRYDKNLYCFDVKAK